MWIKDQNFPLRMGSEHLLTLLLRKHMIKRNQQEGGFILLSGTNKR